jgi:hypothetical protein
LGLGAGFRGSVGRRVRLGLWLWFRGGMDQVVRGRVGIRGGEGGGRGGELWLSLGFRL